MIDTSRADVASTRDADQAQQRRTAVQQERGSDSRVRRTVIARPAWRLVIAALCAVVVLVLPVIPLPSAHAQSSGDWEADDDAARSREIVRRYLRILDRRPERGPIFDRLVQEVGVGTGLQALVERYEERTASDPDDVHAWILLGHLRARLERYEEARAAYVEAVERTPDSPLAHRALADVLRELDEREAAAERYEIALTHATEDDARREILRELADLAFEAHAWDEASAYVERLVALDPSNLYVRLELADLFVRHERYGEAMQQYEAILERAGRDTRQRAVTLRDIGDLHLLMGDYERAVETYRRAASLVEPGYWLRRELQQRVIDAYRRMDRLAELVAEYEESWRSPSVEQLQLLATLYDELGREDDALDAYRTVVRRRPRSIDARLALIRMLERRGEIEQVLEQYRTLVRQSPSDPAHRFRLVELYRRMGDLDEAREELRRIERRFRNEPGTVLELADWYQRLGDDERALDAYERLVRLEPDRPENYIAVGELHFMEGRRSDAETWWRRVLDVIDDEAEARATLGDVYSDHGLVEDAVDQYRRAVELEPDDDGYLRQLASLYQRAGRYPFALRRWEELLRRTEQDQVRAEARRAMVEIHAELGQLQDVIPDYRERFLDDPPDISAGFFVAEALLELGRLSQAEEAFRAILEQRPASTGALTALEDLYVEQSRYSEAIEILQRLVELRPDASRQYYERLADLSLRVYDDDQAVRFAELAVRTNPDDASARARLADIYRRMQRIPEAILAYREAIRLDRRAFAYYFDLAELYLAQGDVDEAAELYKEVVTSSRDGAQVLRAGRRVIQLAQARGRLRELLPLLEPLALRSQGSDVYLKLLVETYEKLLVPLSEIADLGLPAERRQARQELESIGRRALRPLLDALVSEDLSSRTTALELLGILRDPTAALPVARIADEPGPNRAKALLVTAQIASERSIPTLERALETGEPELRELAIWGLGRTGAERARLPLERIVAEEIGAPDSVALALVGLARLPGRSDPELVADALVSESSAVQIAAVWAAGVSDAPAQRERLHDVVRYGRDEVATVACWSVAGAEAAPDDLEVVVEAFVLGGPELRQTCGAALGAYGRAGFSDEAVDLVDAQAAFVAPDGSRFDADRYVRSLLAIHRARAAADTDRGGIEPAQRERISEQLARAVSGGEDDKLARLAISVGAADRGLVPAELLATATGEARSDLDDLFRAFFGSRRVELTTMVEIGEDGRRRAAVVVLGRLGGDEIVPLLETALGDPLEPVARAAVSALGAVGGQAGCRVLSSLVRDERWLVRAEAYRALRDCVAEPAMVAELASAARDEPFATLRTEAWLTLSAWDPGRAAEIALDRWSLEPVSFRVAVARRISALPQPARDAIAQAAAEDVDPQVRAAARAATDDP